MATVEQPELQPQSWTQRARGVLSGLLLSQEGVLLVITIIAVLLLHQASTAAGSGAFLTLDNLMGEVVLLFEVALIALPMTYIIITGGIDLSVGSTLGMSAIILGFLWQDRGLPLELAIFLGVASGALAGFINGFFIVRFGVPPLIMTLATLALYRGMALGISEARSARGFPDYFYQLGRGNIIQLTAADGATIGIPWQVVILLGAIIICGVALARTRFGRGLYAIGNNELAARFAGIPVDRYKLLIYTLSGFMAGLAGWVLTSRVSTTRSDMGTGMELDVIAAVVLGGTSIFGGSGTILGTVLGLILIQVLKNGLLLSDVKGDAATAVIGAILIVAILINNFIQNRFHRA